MNLLADESIERFLVDRLRKDGHSVLYIAETDAGAPDEKVLQLATQVQAILLTEDNDFGELVFRYGRVSAGVLLIRLARLSRKRKEDVISSVIREHAEEIKYTFAVVTPGLIRIRIISG